MNRLIVEVRDGISDMDALYYAMKVVQQGRISKHKSYCAVTTFTNDVQVFGLKNKASDRLIVSRK